MIRLFATGRLGRDATINEPNGKKVLNYSIAIDTGYGDNKTTLWLDCSQWSEKTGVLEYLKKGTLVCVTGEPGLRTYQRNDGTAGASMTLKVDKVELLGSKPENAASTGGGTAERTVPRPQDIIEPIDDLPF